MSSMPSISALKAPSALARSASGHAVEGAADVVGGVQHVAGEVGDRVGAGIGDLALGAAAQVLHLGQRAQERSFSSVALGHRGASASACDRLAGAGISGLRGASVSSTAWAGSRRSSCMSFAIMGFVG